MYYFCVIVFKVFVTVFAHIIASSQPLLSLVTSPCFTHYFAGLFEFENTRVEKPGIL